jgi:voltage-gated potassium channel
MLVGIKRGDKTHVNPPQEFVIQEDELAVLITE